MTIGHKRHLLPFDWRVAKSDIWLSPAVPWEISLKGGMWKLSCDLRGLELRSLEVGGGASDIELWLPAPAGVVPVRISGGASNVKVHRLAATALVAEVTGGASKLVVRRPAARCDGGGRNRFETSGFAAAADRYELRLSGGASQLDRRHRLAAAPQSSREVAALQGGATRRAGRPAEGVWPSSCPGPCVLVAVMSPPWRATIQRAMARPRPLPPRRASAPSRRGRSGRRRASRSAGAMPGPCVGDRTTAAVAGDRQAHGDDAARRRVLDGVAHDVAQGALEVGRVGGGA